MMVLMVNPRLNEETSPNANTEVLFIESGSFVSEAFLQAGDQRKSISKSLPVKISGWL